SGYPKKKFCCSKCYKKHNLTTQSDDVEQGLGSGTKGAIHELQASVDLMRKGWEVFRAVSPSASCDLIAVKGEQLLRIQVTKAHYNKATGKTYYPNHKGEPFDILALSFVTGEVSYIPPLP